MCLVLMDGATVTRAVRQRHSLTAGPALHAMTVWAGHLALRGCYGTVVRWPHDRTHNHHRVQRTRGVRTMLLFWELGGCWTREPGGLWSVDPCRGRGQLLGAADAQTAHPATFSTAPTHQRRGSANAETTPAGAPAAAADRTQRPDATCEGKNG